MPDETPAVVLVQADGAVLTQNRPARRLLGPGAGKRCWDLMRGLPHTRGKLPCRRGCVRELLASGLERARLTRFSLDGRPHHLTCVPVDDVVICALTPRNSESPESWQLLTARERDVLRLIAQGQTTASVAAHFGLSRSTVSTHIEHMFAKLGTRTRAGLVARALRLGLLAY